MRSGTANVLGVKIESSTHDPQDLFQALHDLGKQVGSGQDAFFSRKGFEGACGFYETLPVLSAVVIANIWSSADGSCIKNLVWVNPRAAVRLDAELVKHLRLM